MIAPTIEQTRSVVATLIKMRSEELGYDMMKLPARRYIEDELLLWLINKYDVIQNNIEKGE